MARTPKTEALLADRNHYPMLGPAQTKIADAVVAHDVNIVFNEVEVEAALNALGVKINAILDVLEVHGLMKDA